MGYPFINKISYYLPSKVVSNDDLYALFPESAQDKTLHKIGVKERRIVDKNELASDIGVRAALRLFEEHEVDPHDIDFLIFCAAEYDYYTPTTACLIHQQLGLKESAGAVDYNQGCSGFLYGISMASGLISIDTAKHVLLITTSTLTKELHPKDKSSRFLFGDAAAATLISSSEEERIHQFCFGTDGNGAEIIIKRDGGARNPLSEKSKIETVDRYHNITAPKYLKMDGFAIFSFALKRVPLLVADTLLKNNVELDDIDLFVFHQANAFLLDSLRKKMKIPEDKFYFCLENIGNTVACSIPIALKEAIDEGKAKEGDKIMLVAFGVGLSWGATIVTL